MRLGEWIRSVRASADEGPQRPRHWSDRLAAWSVLATVVGLCAAFALASGTHFLMPGPLTSAHGAIENCSACHTSSGSGKLSWLHGLIAADPLADGKACLSCHKMPETAFDAHGASAEMLSRSTERMMKLVAQTPAPHSARAQGIAFPTDVMVARGLACATCHQEHQGVGFDLKKVSDEQCRSCHVVKFDGFNGQHPEFEGYPFRRRTRIIYDHAGHFDKHFPEVAAKNPARSIPATCSTCHGSDKDRRLMGVAPFEQVCSGCHLDQIKGNDRVSGPKGIAFLTLPGLDLQTLRKKKARIGEWPDASEAALTPFMKVMLSRTDRGRAAIKAVAGLNLQDLSGASDEQVKAVTDLVWEIKELIHSLIEGKPTGVLADPAIGGGRKEVAGLSADLTASIPRDVVIAAHQQWLPNLGAEIGGRRSATDRQPSTSTQPLPPAGSGSPAPREPGRTGHLDLHAAAGDPPPAAKAAAGRPDRTAQQTGAAPAGPADETPKAGDGARRSKAPDQNDDLLFPTEEELRALRANFKDDGKAGRPRAAASKPDSPRTKPQGAASADAVPKADPGTPARPSPAPSIGRDVDPENWAAHGGWYRQDFAISYRPTGHKDKLIHSWLSLTGPLAPRGDTSPAAAVFDFLTGKGGQGACAKCHSVDDVGNKARTINFAPLGLEGKRGRFTEFVHEPHFAIQDERGCLTCHDLERSKPYLQSYAQASPTVVSSNFGAVKKDLCQTCHTGNAARRDCLLCHKYHVNGAITPIMSTRIPAR